MEKHQVHVVASSELKRNSNCIQDSLTGFLNRHQILENSETSFFESNEICRTTLKEKWDLEQQSALQTSFKDQRVLPHSSRIFAELVQAASDDGGTVFFRASLQGQAFTWAPIWYDSVVVKVFTSV